MKEELEKEIKKRVNQEVDWEEVDLIKKEKDEVMKEKEQLIKEKEALIKEK
jgi:hypothetical protein